MKTFSNKPKKDVSILRGIMPGSHGFPHCVLLLAGLKFNASQNPVLLAAGLWLLDAMEQESAGGSLPDDTAQGTNCREQTQLLMPK